VNVEATSAVVHLPHVNGALLGSSAVQPWLARSLSDATAPDRATGQAAFMKEADARAWVGWVRQHPGMEIVSLSVARVLATISNVGDGPLRISVAPEAWALATGLAEAAWRNSGDAAASVGSPPAVLAAVVPGLLSSAQRIAAELRGGPWASDRPMLIRSVGWEVGYQLSFDAARGALMLRVGDILDRVSAAGVDVDAEAAAMFGSAATIARSLRIGVLAVDTPALLPQLNSSRASGSELDDRDLGRGARALVRGAFVAAVNDGAREGIAYAAGELDAAWKHTFSVLQRAMPIGRGTILSHLQGLAASTGRAVRERWCDERLWSVLHDSHTAAAKATASPAEAHREGRECRPSPTSSRGQRRHRR
jgi:hypothetical protein